MSLKEHQEYMQKTFAKMSVGEAQKHDGFISALYATEAFLAKK